MLVNNCQQCYLLECRVNLVIPMNRHWQIAKLRGLNELHI